MWPWCFPSPPSCCGHLTASPAPQLRDLGLLSALPHGEVFPPHPRAHQGKLMGDLAVGWDFGAEAIGGEELVTVVVLDDLPHCLQRQGVGAQLVGARVVQ